jgi:hypothetical protein
VRCSRQTKGLRVQTGLLPAKNRTKNAEG